MRRLAIVLAALLFQPCSVWAVSSAQDYGVDDIVATDQEKTDARRYGGYPNNRDFNNDTRCKAVISLFEIPGVGPQHPKMKAFLSFTRVSLMLFDIAFDVSGVGAAIKAVGPTEWKVLPALVPAYCRQHPGAKLSDAVQGAYTATRITRGLAMP